MLGPIAKNSFWLLIAEGAGKFAQLMVAILVARHFSVEEFGVFGFAFSVVTLIAVVADFGLSSVIIRDLAKCRDDWQKYFGSTIILRLMLIMASFILILSTAALLESEIRLPLLLAGGAVFTAGMSDHLRIAFRIQEQMHYEAMVKVASAVSLMVLASISVLMRFSIASIYIGFVLANIIGLLFAASLLGKIPLCIDYRIMKQMLKASWPLFLGLISTTAYGQMDLIFIKLFRGVAEVGIYQAAYRLLFGFQLLKVIHMSMFPRLASLNADNDTAGYRKLNQTFIMLSLAVLIPAGIILTFIPDKIIVLLYGCQYAEASRALPLLIWSGIISFMASYFTYTLIITAHQKLWLWCEYVVLVLLISIELILIPTTGFMGAAIATFAGELVFLVMVMVGVFVNPQLRARFF